MVVVRVIALVPGIGWVCLAINAEGCLGAAQIIKSAVCGWCKFGVFFASLVIMSLSLEEGVDVEVGSEEWEERFLEKLLVRLKDSKREGGWSATIGSFGVWTFFVSE